MVLIRGWVTLRINFRGKRGSPTNDTWRQKTGVSGLSRGIVCVILHFDTIPASDRQTDIR